MEANPRRFNSPHVPVPQPFQSFLYSLSFSQTVEPAFESHNRTRKELPLKLMKEETQSHPLGDINLVPVRLESRDPL
jgi:hypothetical protein